MEYKPSRKSSLATRNAPWGPEGSAPIARRIAADLGALRCQRIKQSEEAQAPEATTLPPPPVAAMAVHSKALVVFQMAIIRQSRGVFDEAFADGQAKIMV